MSLIAYALYLKNDTDGYRRLPTDTGGYPRTRRRPVNARGRSWAFVVGRGSSAGRSWTLVVGRDLSTVVNSRGQLTGRHVVLSGAATCPPATRISGRVGRSGAGSWRCARPPAVMVRVWTVLWVALALAWCPVNAFRVTLGMNIDPTNTQHGDPPAANLTTAGATWARLEYKDAAGAGQPPTPSVLAFYRDKAAALVNGGVRVLMLLDYSSLPGRPAASAPSPQWASYTTAFAARAAAVAKSMGKYVAAYEIWNEPDLTTVGNVPAAEYGPLLEAAYRALQVTVPSATVVMGGLASGNPTYVADARAATGGVLYADAVGLHPYGQRPTPDWPSPTWGFGVLTTLLRSYHQVEPKPVWITEVGTNVGGSTQAQFPDRTLAAVAADGSAAMCDVVFWFCWSDGMVSGFGLLTAAGVPKPSYSSFQAFARGQR